MTDDLKRLEEIGARAADALGDGPSNARRDAQRQALVSHVARSHRRSRLRAVIPVAAAALLAAALGVVFYDAPGTEMTFWVGDAASPGEMGQLVEAPKDLSLPIRFDGGSEIEILEQSAAEVLIASREKVLVEFKEGDLRARIRGNGTTRWQVAAGPYRVAVMGTTFSVSWDARLAVLDVLVEEGVVKVSGAALDGREIRLAAGNHLTVDDNEVRLGRVDADQSTDGRESAAIAEAPAEEPADDPSSTPPEIAPTRNASSTTSRPASTPAVRDEGAAIRELYAARSYGAAVDAAEEAGLGRLLQTLDREDLWKLASAARYAGRGQTALAALGALRVRFPGSERSRTATFLLGRTSLELTGDPRTARRWFETYLTENPHGSLAEESLGRLIDACQAAGQREEARQRAEIYLARHPRGSFADLARSALSE